MDIVKLHNLALGHYSKGMHLEAIEVLNQVIKANTRLAEAYFNRGMIRGTVGDYEGEIEDYNQALRLNFNHIDLHYNLGAAYYSLKDYENAIKELEKVLKEDPLYIDAHDTLGLVYAAKEFFQIAIEHYSNALRINSTRSVTRIFRCIAHLKLGDFQAATKDINILNKQQQVIADEPMFYVARSLYRYHNQYHQGVIEDSNRVRVTFLVEKLG